MSGAVFQAFKVSLDGRHDKWGHVLNLTHDEARDGARFPYGRQTEKDGRAFTWSYSVMPRHLEPVNVGAPSRPLPSALGAIIEGATRRHR